MRLLTAAQVKASPDGRLLLSVEGRTQAYVGLEEGLFRHESREELLLFETGADGRTWIHSDGAPAHPSFTATSAFRVPWHESSSAAALVLLSGLLLFAASPVGWAVAAVAARRRGKGSAAVPRAARLAAACFGGLFLLFLAALAATLGDIDPACGVPRAFIGGATPLADVAMWFPLAMTPLALALAAFALLAWPGTGNGRRPYWGAAARLHYAVLALSAVAIVSLLWFWNLTALAG